MTDVTLFIIFLICLSSKNQQLSSNILSSQKVCLRKIQGIRENARPASHSRCPSFWEEKFICEW